MLISKYRLDFSSECCQHALEYMKNYFSPFRLNRILKTGIMKMRSERSGKIYFVTIDDLRIVKECDEGYVHFKACVHPVIRDIYDCRMICRMDRFTIFYEYIKYHEHAIVPAAVIGRPYLHRKQKRLSDYEQTVYDEVGGVGQGRDRCQGMEASMISKEKYKHHEGGFTYVTYPMVREHHGNAEFLRFIDFMGGQTVGIELQTRLSAIYSWDYERWLREEKKNRKLLKTWD